MAGRKCVIEPSLVIDAVMFYKESVIFTNKNGEKSKLRKIITFLIRFIVICTAVVFHSGFKNMNYYNIHPLKQFYCCMRHCVFKDLYF